MALNDKKTLYHSMLVTAGEVEVTINSAGPERSKFDKAGSYNHYIKLRHEGTEHFLELENDECAQALTGLQGQTVTLKAEGSRENATITVFDAPQNHRQPHPQPRHQEPARQPAQRPPAGRESLPQRPLPQNPAPASQTGNAPHRTPEEREKAEYEAFKKASRTTKQAGLLMSLCIEQAKIAAGDTLTNEDIRQLGITLFIEVKGRIDIHALPITRPGPAPQQQPPPRQQAPPPRREPERKPEEDRVPMEHPGDFDDEADIPF